MKHFRSINHSFIFLCLTSLALSLLPNSANAQMVLTANAIAAGFGLSTFATGFPSSSNIGPFGIAFDGNKVIVSENLGNVRIFPTDTDGQTVASAPIAQYYGFGDANGIGSGNGRYYMAQYFAGKLIQINASGTFNQTIVAGIVHPEGVVVIPANGHVFVATDSGILDVNPATHTSRVFQPVRADGLTTDGTTLYAVITGGHIIGYRLSDGIQVFDSGFINDGPDGTALGAGTLAGTIFANTNGGRLLEFNLAGTPVATVIGTGGSRGDYVTVDPNGTLLLTQTDRILRLTAPLGGGFGTPEPGPIAMLLASALTGGLFLRRRRANRVA